MLLVLAAAFLAALFAARNQAWHKAASNARIDDLTIPAAELLKLSPDVTKIETLLTPFRPTHRIIHIADRHYISRERLRNYQRDRTDEGFTDYVQQIEKLQAAQYRLLRMLVDRHALRQVFAEGESTDSSCAEGIEWLRRAEAMDDGNELRERLRAAIDEADAKGEDSTGLRNQERLLERAQGYKFYLGAACELAVARPCVDILPAENQVAFEAALEADHLSNDWIAATEAREDAIVANLLKVPCAVIILGGGHDLSKSITRLGGGRCDYLKVSVTGYSAPSSESIRSSLVAYLGSHYTDAGHASRGPLADNQTALVSLAIAIFFVIVASRMFAHKMPEDEEDS